MLQSMGSQRVGHDLATERQESREIQCPQLCLPFSQPLQLQTLFFWNGGHRGGIREAELTEVEWKPEGTLSRPLPGPSTLACQRLPPTPPSLHPQPPQGGQRRSRVGTQAAASLGNRDEPGPELKLEVGEFELPEIGRGSDMSP